MRLLRRAALVLALLLSALLAWVLVQAQRHPDLPAEPAAWMPAAPAGSAGLRVRFVGVATLLFDDGETAWMSDGFFSRPGKLAMAFSRLEPDRAEIDKALRKLGVSRLAAVVPLHSHYDHAMDAPVVAERTGAQLVGSSSTLMVGRGLGLPARQMREVKDGDVVQLGRFRLTFLESRHSPTLWTAADAPSEHITEPVLPPAHASAYKEGAVWSLLVEHDGRSLLVQGSAGYLPGLLQGRRADTVLLGVGTLGRKSPQYIDAYWRETVGLPGARRVIPIHWDDFWRPLDAPLQAMPLLVDDFAATWAALRERGARDGVEVKLPPLWLPIDPFASPAGTTAH
jgi:L-ascorbate metabolism protein UlaG (beta-lactamase superfamily)